MTQWVEAFRDHATPLRYGKTPRAVAAAASLLACQGWAR